MFRFAPLTFVNSIKSWNELLQYLVQLLQIEIVLGETLLFGTNYRLTVISSFPFHLRFSTNFWSSSSNSSKSSVRQTPIFKLWPTNLNHQSPIVLFIQLNCDQHTLTVINSTIPIVLFIQLNCDQPTATVISSSFPHHLVIQDFPNQNVMTYTCAYCFKEFDSNKKWYYNRHEASCQGKLD